MASWQVYRGERGADFTWDSQLYLVSPELVPVTWSQGDSTQEKLNGCRAAQVEAKQAGKVVGTVSTMLMTWGGEERRESCMTFTRSSKVAGKCIIFLGFGTTCAMPGRFKRQLPDGWMWEALTR